MKKIVIPFLAFAALTACVEDEGTYKYTPVNQVAIGAIESATVLSKVDTLRITPELEGSVYGEDESKYDFKWHLCLAGHANHRVISTERNLEWFVDVNPGTYTLYFTVTDKDTKLETNVSSSFTAVSALSKGFVVLGNNESSGLLGMDMIAMPPNRDTVVVKDIFDNSELQLKNPERVQFTGYGAMNYKPACNLFWLYADNKAYNMTFKTEFEIIAEFRDMGMIEPDIDGFDPSSMQMRDMFPYMGLRATNLYNRYGGYITDKYVVFNGQTAYTNFYTAACNRYTATSTEYFKPYPYVMFNNAVSSGSSINSNNPPILYDMDNDIFVKINFNYGLATSVARFTESPSDVFLFDARSQNRTLFYAQNTFDSSGMSCVIMRGTNDDSWHIYRFKHRTYSWYADTKQYYRVDPAVATDFDKASHYMFSSNRTAIFYSVDNRLYQYDYARRLLLYKDFDGEITLLRSEHESQSERDAFFVATYDPTNKGTIYKMYHGANANQLSFEESPEEIWHTDLKVVSIVWKNS